MRKRMMYVIAALLLVAVSAQATVSPVAKGVYNSAGITLSTGSSSWSADLTTYANFIGDVYQIGGYFSGDPSSANVEYQDNPTEIYNYGLSGPFVKVGPNTGGSYKGWVLYKFVLPSGQVTAAGGTITANALRVNNMDASITWMGVNGSEITGTNTVDLGSTTDEAAFVKTNFPKPASGWGSYGTLSLDIPQGVSQFYVAFLEDWGSNEKICYQGLDVNAVIIPEPATLFLLGLGGLALVKRK